MGPGWSTTWPTRCGVPLGHGQHVRKSGAYSSSKHLLVEEKYQMVMVLYVGTIKGHLACYEEVLEAGAAGLK